jgi:hypothetical protein
MVFVFMTILIVFATSGCAALTFSPGLHPSRRHSTFTTRASATPTPEELLMEAVVFMRENALDKARAALDKAQRLCDRNGGATEEQASLLKLLASRLPVSMAKGEKDPTLSEMFPGTSAAPTGKSLILPGTPSMAELGAKLKAKRQAAADAARRAGDAGGPRMCVPIGVPIGAHAQLCRRSTLFPFYCTAPLAANAETELELFDFLSFARFAVKKQRQKQEQCLNEGEYAENTPYYRRLASQEINNFAIYPASSTILLLAASALVLQWGSIAVRIAAGLDAPKISLCATGSTVDVPCLM